eukprot:COSAG06_NODE_25220_length_642_cov_0.736648_1_plen_35_part_10
MTEIDRYSVPFVRRRGGWSAARVVSGGSAVAREHY